MNEKLHSISFLGKKDYSPLHKTYSELNKKLSEKSMFCTGLPKKVFSFLRQDLFQLYKRNFLMRFYGIVVSISRRRFSTKKQKSALQVFYRRDESLIFSRKIVSVGFPTVGRTWICYSRFIGRRAHSDSFFPFLLLRDFLPIFFNLVFYTGFLTWFKAS